MGPLLVPLLLLLPLHCAVFASAMAIVGTILAGCAVSAGDMGLYLSQTGQNVHLKPDDKTSTTLERSPREKTDVVKGVLSDTGDQNRRNSFHHRGI